MAVHRHAPMAAPALPLFLCDTFEEPQGLETDVGEAGGDSLGEAGGDAGCLGNERKTMKGISTYALSNMTYYAACVYVSPLRLKTRSVRDLQTAVEHFVVLTALKLRLAPFKCDVKAGSGRIIFVNGRSSYIFFHFISAVVKYMLQVYSSSN